MRLLERAGELLEDEDAVVTDRDVKQALALLDALARRPTLAALRGDLAAARAQLAKAGGASIRKIVEDLMGPRRPGRKPAGRPRQPAGEQGRARAGRKRSPSRRRTR
jgi:hypothetical protein